MDAIKSNYDIHVIDCHYLQPGVAASFLMVEKDEALFIENNTANAHRILMDALESKNVKPENVKYIIVSHVHLDHAGGTSALIHACPNATVLAHPRAVPHIVNPEKLIAGAKAVYGEEGVKSLYGEIDPVDESRVRAMKDQEKIVFGSRELCFIHTPGHAKHHMSIYDSKSNSVFAGDAMGLGYPALQTGIRPFVYPTCSPVQFDPVESKKSINRLIQTGADKVYLTHFGLFSDFKACSDMMIDYCDKLNLIILSAIDEKIEGNQIDQYCTEKFREFFDGEVLLRGIEFSDEMIKMFNLDNQLNGAGLGCAVRRIMKSV